MELIMEQFPIVIQSLNVGFLQYIEAFLCDAFGGIASWADHCIWLNVAFPAIEIYHEHYCMGSQRNAADDPDADYLLFPGTGIE